MVERIGSEVRDAGCSDDRFFAKYVLRKL